MYKIKLKSVLHLYLGLIKTPLLLP